MQCHKYNVRDTKDPKDEREQNARKIKNDFKSLLLQSNLLLRINVKNKSKPTLKDTLNILYAHVARTKSFLAIHSFIHLSIFYLTI
jgi:hypothetical protein